jgi:hypothetical protein
MMSNIFYLLILGILKLEKAEKRDFIHNGKYAG